MRGSIFYNGKTISGIHLSVDPESRNLHFSRYDLESDSFEALLSLKEFQLFVPGDEILAFSGYRPLEEGRFDYLSVEFFPCRADFIHDSWTEKMSGRSAGNSGLIKE